MFFGDFFGKRQHGLPELRLADMVEDMDTLRLCLTPFIPMLKTMRVLKENMRAAAALITYSPLESQARMESLRGPPLPRTEPPVA